MRNRAEVSKDYRVDSDIDSTLHNFHHYHVSFKMNNFRLLYPTNYACNSVSYLFLLVLLLLLLFFFCREKTLRNSCRGERTQSKCALTTYPDSRTAHTVTNEVESGFLYLRVIE